MIRYYCSDCGKLLKEQNTISNYVSKAYSKPKWLQDLNGFCPRCGAPITTLKPTKKRNGQYNITIKPRVVSR